MSRRKDREIANDKKNILMIGLTVLIINIVTIMVIISLVMIGVLEFKNGSLTVHKEVNVVENKMDTFIMPTNNSVAVRANAVIDHFITDDMSDYEKVKVIHDWLVEWATYDYSEYNTNETDTNSNEEYGVFMRKKAGCAGYSETFSLLCELAGIKSEVITGTATDIFNDGGHVWNNVQIDDKWYGVDVTWDDYITDKSDGTILYDYFLVTDEVMKITHEWDKKDFEDCMSDKYMLKAYKDSGLLASTSAQLRKIFDGQYKEGKTIITIVYTKQGIPSLEFIDKKYGAYTWSYSEIGDACRVTIVMGN